MQRGGREPWFLRFHDLMPFRVREILLVSSSYDAFILEEDGWLTERFFTEASELNLSWSPRITHVATAAAALDLLSRRPFDLVMTVVLLPDADAIAFSQQVKARHPGLPLVLLTFHEADLGHLPGGVAPDTIDRVVLWTGDTRILLATIKLIEDEKNIEHDTRIAGVQVILVVEDLVRPYSTFLALLYWELMTQSRSLIAEGLNDLHKLMRMWARPKLLLANTFEDAVAYYRRYQEHLMAVISDVRFPRGGAPDPEAGLALLKLVRRESPDLPILLLSAEPDFESWALAHGVYGIAKHSPNLHGQIRTFLKDALGFGDFVFRLPDRTEVARARDLYELEHALHTVPAASVEYHAARNHFSMWLSARSMFDLAHRLKRLTIAQFRDIEAVRRYLIDVLQKALFEEQEMVITDFSPRKAGHDAPFVRLAKGSVGGKGRGIAFVNSLLVRHGLSDAYPGLEIRTPRTVAIGTSVFDQFLEDNVAADHLPALRDDAVLIRRFLHGRLRTELLHDLRMALGELHGPLAVRSSSLLEDSRFQPFAGIYATYMLPNNAADPQVRFTELCQAIKAVYASIYCANARTYFKSTPHSVEEEKMAVIIQEVVGQRYGERFYPHISGVAQSYNYYPVGAQRAEEGIALIALGLGETVVSGGAALRFSPGAPTALPQFGSVRDHLRLSQATFYALNLARPTVDFVAGSKASLDLCDLADAEEDGTLELVGSVYCEDDGVIRDSLALPGPRLVTFNNVLRWNLIPLAQALAGLLQHLRAGVGCEVEIEFAVDMGPARGAAGRPPCLYILQVRPMAVQSIGHKAQELASGPRERIFCRTGRSLGHGVIDGIRDVVYVKLQALGPGVAQAVAAQVGEVTAGLQAEGAPYLLIGPGRWGSADPNLGIPVGWSQIAGVRVIIETRLGGRHIEPSQGTHFFQNVVSLRIGYLTVSGGSEEVLDLAWLDQLPAHRETPRVRHVRLPGPLYVHLDGWHGRATIVKPT
jgi:CheY-like chemotaxis protein